MTRRVLPFLILTTFLLGSCGYHLSGREWTADSVLASADKGDAEAQRIAGDMYYWGEDVPQNWAFAQAYWELAAAQGEPLAIERMEDLRSGEPIIVVSDGGTGRRFFGSANEDLSSEPL